MNRPKVPFVALNLQYLELREELMKKFDEVSSSGNYVLGGYLEKFESEFAEYCDAKYAVGVGNATDGISIVVKSLGLKSGDEVITVPNSFIATAGALGVHGIKPVFVDVRNDFNIDPKLIEQAITAKTRAIMPVHLTGRPADMDPIMSIAKERGLYVIEDAAQAVGAKYKGRMVGSIGDAAVFSLHPLKNLHVHGDGGIITTSDENLNTKLRKMRNHGLINRDECEVWGFNSRLDSLQAAIGSIKLKKLDIWNGRHREIAGRYSDVLSRYVKTPEWNDEFESVFHCYVVITEDRSKLQTYLSEKGIETKVHYPIPIHLQKAAKDLNYNNGSFPNTEFLSPRILSLPIYPELTDNQVQYVCDEISKYFS